MTTESLTPSGHPSRGPAPRFAPSQPVIPTIAGSSRRYRRRAGAYAIAAVCFITAFQIFILSAGGKSPWPQYTAYFDLQADAFLHGQVSLLERPDPKLLSLPDPYNPALNVEMRLHDASLYGGRYYLYWGPVPALLLVPVKWVLARLGNTEAVGDQYLVITFCLALTGLMAALVLRVRARWFAQAPPWTVLLPIGVAGLSTPVMFLMARGAVYEAAILGGQFFLLAGFLIALEGFYPREGSRPGVRRSSGPHSIRLVLIGLCWALALGCRPSLLFAVAALAMFCTWRLLRTDATWPRRVARIGALGLTLVAGGATYGAYNYIRFDNPAEFGQRYQLCGRNIHAVAAAGDLFRPANAPPGLWSYFFRPVYPLAHFPFLLARPGEGTFPSFIHLPKNYETQDEIAGVVLVVPFLWLIVIPLTTALRRRKSKNTSAEQNVAPSPRAGLNWLILCLLAASVLGFGPILFMCGSTMRYLADLTPPLVIVAAIGFWLRLGDLNDRTRPRVRFVGMAVVLALVSVVIGMLLSFTGYYRHMERNNPALFYALGGRPLAEEIAAEERAAASTRPTTGPVPSARSMEPDASRSPITERPSASGR